MGFWELDISVSPGWLGSVPVHAGACGNAVILPGPQLCPLWSPPTSALQCPPGHPLNHSQSDPHTPRSPTPGSCPSPQLAPAALPGLWPLGRHGSFPIYLSVCTPLLSPAWSTVPHTHLHPGSRPRCGCSVDQSHGTLGRQHACHPQQTPLGSSMSPVPRPSRCPGNPPSVPHADAGFATDSPQVSGLSDAAPGPEAAASIKASFSSSC